MEAKLLILKRIFESLGIQPTMGGVDDRKLKQKAVYLCQIMGLDLGYRYGWYLMGPYSPGLAKDYYALAEIAQDNDDARQLNQNTMALLANVQNLIDDQYRPPNMDREGWFELLASWHYLTRVNGRTEQQARQTIQQQKPHLSSSVNSAIQRFQAIN